MNKKNKITKPIATRILRSKPFFYCDSSSWKITIWRKNQETGVSTVHRVDMMRRFFSFYIRSSPFTLTFVKNLIVSPKASPKRMKVGPSHLYYLNSGDGGEVKRDQRGGGQDYGRRRLPAHQGNPLLCAATLEQCDCFLCSFFSRFIRHLLCT